jgi:hypothetical protein
MGRNVMGALPSQQATPLVDVIFELGSRMGFDVKREVQASESAWVDLVWFDKRLGLTSFPAPMLRRHPVLPIVGFELEEKTGLDAKHVKGSASNLNNLGAAVGVVVIGNGNISELQKSGRRWTTSSTDILEKELIQRVYRWVYAEAQPRGRIVVMTEREVRKWAEGVPAVEPATLEVD